MDLRATFLRKCTENASSRPATGVRRAVQVGTRGASGGPVANQSGSKGGILGDSSPPKRTSAPRWPHTWQTNRPSRWDSRRLSGQQSVSITTSWLHLWSLQLIRTTPWPEWRSCLKVISWWGVIRKIVPRVTRRREYATWYSCDRIAAIDDEPGAGLPHFSEGDLLFALHFDPWRLQLREAKQRKRAGAVAAS
jgi:hypothetical protein